MNQRTIFRHLILRLFERHFADPRGALIRFEKNLERTPLPFDLSDQIRELSHPSLPNRPPVPSLIYYYVPKSGWGTQNEPPSNPLDPNFVKVADGIGLNMGCPVRLLRALDIFVRLSPEDQLEVRHGLVNPTQHLAAIEELLLLEIWEYPSNIQRGGKLPGGMGDVDWYLKVLGIGIFLEAKFRPSDWPRRTDLATFAPSEGSFLNKAFRKFPNPPHDRVLYVAGITALERIRHGNPS